MKEAKQYELDFVDRAGTKIEGLGYVIPKVRE